MEEKNKYTTALYNCQSRYGYGKKGGNVECYNDFKALSLQDIF
jgi:hypothetical protein